MATKLATIHAGTPRVVIELTDEQLVTLRKGLVALRYQPNVPTTEHDRAVALEDDLTQASIILLELGGHR